jgi:hypothetical protein
MFLLMSSMLPLSDLQAIVILDIVSSCKQLISLFFGKQDEQTYLNIYGYPLYEFL